MATYGTQKTGFTFQFIPGPRAAGSGTVTFIAPLDGTATVAANYIQSYSTATGTAADHGADSLLHEAAKIAQQGNILTWEAVGFADKTTSSPYTFGDSSALDTDTLAAADLPLYEVTAVEIDGTAVDRINYTEQDPTGVALDDTGNGEAWINTSTGVIQLSRSTSGASTGCIVTYSSADIDPVLDQIKERPHDVVTFAGWRYNAQYYGMFKYLVEWAEAQTVNAIVAAAMDDSITVALATPLAAALPSDSFFLVAAKLETASDDLSSGVAARLAATHASGSLKDQPGPNGIDLSTSAVPYTRAEFGDDLDPGATTFHGIGVNVLTRIGTFSSDRAVNPYATDLTDTFISTRRAINATNEQVAIEVEHVLTSSPTNVLFDKPGLAALKASVQTGLLQSSGLRYIDPAYEVRFPALADIPTADRQKRTIQNVEYDVRVLGKVHTVFFQMGVSF